MKNLLIIKLVCVILASANDNLEVVYQWDKIDFEYPNANERNEALENKTFIPENVMPVGLEVYQKRLFITLPRWKMGVPASLAYIDITDNSTKSPLLKPYPSWSAHKQMVDDEAPEIVSPFRIRADRCGRLWVLDTGVVEILGDSKILAPTSLLVYDLRNDNLLKRYKFPSAHIKEDSFFANIAVEDFDCDNTFAYAADLGSPALVVYSWKSQESWRVKHHFFHPDPLSGNYSIAGINFQWDDGLFGLALSKPQNDSYSTLYFHPFSSTNEFSVSTKILRNQTLATSDVIYKDFKLLGSRGPNGQSSVSFLDQKTGVIFYALPNLNAVACWKTSNRDRSYNYKSIGRVYMNPVDMVFPNDIKVDDESRLWVLSDRLHQFMYSNLNMNDTNFRILTATVKDAIASTACDTKPKPLPDIITKLGDLLNSKTAQTTPVPKSGASNSYSINKSILLLLIGLMLLFN